MLGTDFEKYIIYEFITNLYVRIVWMLRYPIDLSRKPKYLDLVGLTVYCQ